MPVKEDSLVFRWFTDVWNSGRAEKIHEYMTPDCVVHGLIAPGVDGVGPDDFLQFYNGFRSQFDNIHIAMGDTVVENDLEVVRCHVTARHIATGKKVEFTGMTMARVKDGKLVEGWNNFDFGLMEQQIAAI